jgi:hypothetical protein
MHSVNDASFARRQFVWIASAALSAVALIGSSAFAGEESQGKEKWVASWAASAHGPYPSGNAVAQPNLSFAFGSTATGMMRDEFLTNSTLGTIDHLHPNRAGYLSMAKTIDLRVLAPAVREGDD